MDFIRLVFSILVPPIGVLLEKGVGITLLVNIVLTVLGYVPGVIHATFVIAAD